MHSDYVALSLVTAKPVVQEGVSGYSVFIPAEDFSQAYLPIGDVLGYDVTIQKLVIQLALLHQNIGELEMLVDAEDTLVTLGADRYRLLQEQLTAMRSYRTILRERLEDQNIQLL